VPAFAAFTRRFQREVAEQGPQHHVHLHVGEGGADASPGPPSGSVTGSYAPPVSAFDARYADVPDRRYVTVP
jgi:hypothetical protein